MHLKAFSALQNGKTIPKALLEAGYSEKTSNFGQSKIQKSKSWQALLDYYLPEDGMLNRHQELLDTRQYREVVTGSGKDKVVERVDDGPDRQTVLKALELGYKLRKRVGSDNESSSTNPYANGVYNLFYQQNVQNTVRTFEESLKKQITNGIIEKDQGDIREVSSTGQDEQAN